LFHEYFSSALGAMVNFEVRYLSERDIGVFSIIYNKFVTDEPFLYQDLNGFEGWMDKKN